MFMFFLHVPSSWSWKTPSVVPAPIFLCIVVAYTPVYRNAANQHPIQPHLWCRNFRRHRRHCLTHQCVMPYSFDFSGNFPKEMFWWNHFFFHRHVFLHFSSSCFFDSLWKSFARICTVSGVAQCNASNQLPHLRCRRSHRRHSLQGKQFQGEATRSGNRNTCECLVTAKEFDHLSECGCWAKVLLVANLEILYYVQFQYQEYRLSHKGFPIHHPKPCLCWHAFGHGRHRLPDCIIPVTVTAKNRTEFLCGVCGHTCNSGPGIAGGSWSVCLVDTHFAREQQKDAAP